MPPVSIYAALDTEFELFDVRTEIQWFGKQNNIAEFETQTDDFALVNLMLSWRPLAENQNVVVQLAGENLFDTTGRRHSSFSKEFLPLTGRNVKAGVSV